MALEINSQNLFQNAQFQQFVDFAETAVKADKEKAIARVNAGELGGIVNPVILQSADDDLLLIHADIGEIPPENRDRIRAAAMEANFLYQGTAGATLAVDPRSGHLHLQKYNWFDRLDTEKAVTTLTRFADTVKTWKELVAEAAMSAPAAIDDQPAQMPGGFMQV